MRSHEFIATLHHPKIPDSSRIKEVFGSLPFFDQELDRQNAEDFADKAISYSNVVYPCQLLAASKCFKLPRSAQFLAFKLIQAVCSDATSAPGAVSRSTDIYSMTRIDETCPAERGQVVSTPSSPPWQVTNLALDILDLL